LDRLIVRRCGAGSPKHAANVVMWVGRNPSPISTTAIRSDRDARALAISAG